MGKYFGTDGFRGVAGKELTALMAYKIGRFLGAISSEGKRGKIAIGKDTRLSSYMLEYAICAGAVASGADVYLLHVSTTPSVSYITRCDSFDYGIMISASHNPYYDNGIKIICKDGEKVGDDFTSKIEEYIDSEDTLPTPSFDKIGKTYDYVHGRNRYTGYLISLSKHSYRGYRVGIDSANGASWMLASSIFETLGAEVYSIGNNPTGTNINYECGSTHIDALRELVKKEGLDIGFAFDGDADRCLAVDSNGEVIGGEAILLASAKHLRRNGELPNGVVSTIMSNLGLKLALQGEGIPYFSCDVGDRFVYEKMLEVGATLGGEESGHIIYKKHSATGDGLITAIKLMEILIESKAKSSEITRALTLLPQETRSIRVISKDEAINSKKLRLVRDECERELSGHGRILVRKSGTEPVIRLMVEAESKERCLSLLDRLEGAIEEYRVK